jgi:hypothetical protein
MTLTRIQTKMYLIFSSFRISIDIVWASGFNSTIINLEFLNKFISTHIADWTDTPPTHQVH